MNGTTKATEPTAIRTTPVRFTFPSLGLVRAENPYRFVDRTVGVGDEGRLIVQGDLPFSIPDGWVLVVVDDPDGPLYCPVDPGMVEPIPAAE